MSLLSCRRLGQTFLLLALCLAVSACANKKINKDNFDKITNGMTLQEVREILGEAGTKQAGDAAAGVAGQFTVNIPGAEAPKNPATVYVWERGEITITVHFDQNGKVVAKVPKGL
jgi:hypothetical protein